MSQVRETEFFFNLMPKIENSASSKKTELSGVNTSS
jgi:hypothetical protein